MWKNNGERMFKILKIKENKDGSATITLDMSKDIETMLMEEGLLSIIKKYIKKENK